MSILEFGDSTVRVTRDSLGEDLVVEKSWDLPPLPVVGIYSLFRSVLENLALRGIVEDDEKVWVCYRYGATKEPSFWVALEVSYSHLEHLFWEHFSSPFDVGLPEYEYLEEKDMSKWVLSKSGLLVCPDATGE